MWHLGVVSWLFKFDQIHKPSILPALSPYKNTQANSGSFAPPRENTPLTATITDLTFHPELPPAVWLLWAPLLQLLFFYCLMPTSPVAHSADRSGPLLLRQSRDGSSERCWFKHVAGVQTHLLCRSSTASTTLDLHFIRQFHYVEWVWLMCITPFTSPGKTTPRPCHLDVGSDAAMI